MLFNSFPLLIQDTHLYTHADSADGHLMALAIQGTNAIQVYDLNLLTYTEESDNDLELLTKAKLNAGKGKRSQLICVLISCREFTECNPNDII